MLTSSSTAIQAALPPFPPRTRRRSFRCRAVWRFRVNRQTLAVIRACGSAPSNYLMIVLGRAIYLTNRLDSIRRRALALSVGRRLLPQQPNGCWQSKNPARVGRSFEVERMIVSAGDSLRPPADLRTARPREDY